MLISLFHKPLVHLQQRDSPLYRLCSHFSYNCFTIPHSIFFSLCQRYHWINLIRKAAFEIEINMIIINNDSLKQNMQLLLRVILLRNHLVDHIQCSFKWVVIHVQRSKLPMQSLYFILTGFFLFYFIIDERLIRFLNQLIVFWLCHTFLHFIFQQLFDFFLNLIHLIFIGMKSLPIPLFLYILCYGINLQFL